MPEIDVGGRQVNIDPAVFEEHGIRYQRSNLLFSNIPYSSGRAVYGDILPNQELTDAQRFILSQVSGVSSDHISPIRPDISSFITAPQWQNRPQAALDTLGYVTRTSADIISFDIESLGLYDFTPGKDLGLDVFTPTEVSFRKYGFDVDSMGYRERTGQGLSLIVKPSDEVISNIGQIMEKVRRGQGLTESERRSLIDVMRYSRQPGSLPNDQLFGGAEIQEMTVMGSKKLRAIRGHHGIFTAPEKVYGMSNRELAKYLGHVESGLVTLDRYGVAPGNAISTINAYMKAQDPTSVYMGYNSAGFDINALDQFYSKHGSHFPKIQKHLDLLELNKTVYGHGTTLESLLDRTGHTRGQLHTSWHDTADTMRVFNYQFDDLTGKLTNARLRDMQGQDIPLDQLHYSPLARVRKGSKLFAFRGVPDDELSFAFEMGRGGEYHRPYGRGAAHARAFYEVRNMFQITGPKENPELLNPDGLVGVELFSPQTGRGAIITAQTEEELASKLQSGFVDADAFTPQQKRAITIARKQDFARRRYERMSDLGDRRGFRGMGVAERFYRAVSNLEQMVNQNEVSLNLNRPSKFSDHILERAGLRTTAEMQDFRVLFKRLRSEKDVMLPAIETIQRQGGDSANLAWRLFNLQLSPHKDPVERLGYNARGVYARNLGADAHSWINLQTMDSARASIMRTINESIGDDFSTQAARSASQRQYLSHIMQGMVDDGVLTIGDMRKVLLEDGVHQRASTLATVLSRKDISVEPTMAESMRVRRGITISGRPASPDAIATTVRSISEKIGDTRISSPQDLSIMLEQRLVNKAMKDQHRQSVVNFAQNVYSHFTGRGLGVSVVDSPQAGMQMLLYRESDIDSVLSSLVEGKHSSKVVSIPIPTFDTQGVMQVGHRRMFPQTVLGMHDGRITAQGPLDLIQSQLTGWQGDRLHTRILSGDFIGADRDAKTAISAALEPLSGATKWLRDTDRTEPVASMNIGNYLSSRMVVFNKLAQGRFGTDYESLTHRQKTDLMDEVRTWHRGLSQRERELYNLAGDPTIHGARPSATLGGKLGTVDVRDITPFGRYAKTTREALVQEQNYYPLSERAIREAGTRDDMTLGTVFTTPMRERIERDLDIDHVPGITTKGLILDDAQLKTLHEQAIAKARRDIADTSLTDAQRASASRVLKELSEWNTLGPRTYENQAIIRSDVADLFTGRVEKDYRFKLTDATEEFQNIYNRYQEGIRTIDPGDITLAKGKNILETYNLKLSQAGFRGGSIEVLDLVVSGEEVSMKVAENVPMTIGAKGTVASEKFTVGLQPSKEAMQYMTGRSDVSYIHAPKYASHKTFHAPMMSMLNLTRERAVAEGREEEFIRQAKAQLGINIRGIRDARGMEKYLIKEYGAADPALFGKIRTLAESFGVSEEVTLPGGVRGVVDMNEVRMAVQDEHLYRAGPDGIGRGAKITHRELQTLHEKGMLFRDPTKAITRVGGADNLTAVGKWLLGSLDMDPAREAYVAQARGHLDTLASVIRPGRGPSGDIVSARYLQALPEVEALRGLYDTDTLSGTIFDQTRFVDQSGAIDPSKGFYLDLPTDVSINVGRKETRRINKLWVGPQQIGRTDEGALVLDEAQTALNRLTQSIKQYHENVESVPRGLSHAEIMSRGRITKDISRYTQEFVDKAGVSLGSGRGTFLEKAVGGRLASSGMFRTQIISPEIFGNIDSAIDLSQAGTAYISPQAAREMFGDLSQEITVSKDQAENLFSQKFLASKGVKATKEGYTIPLRGWLEEEGMYGLTERYPNIHYRAISPAKIRMSSQVSGHAIALDPITAWLMNADADGDLQAFMGAYSEKLKNNPRALLDAQLELKSHWADSLGAGKTIQGRTLSGRDILKQINADISEAALRKKVDPAQFESFVHDYMLKGRPDQAVEAAHLARGMIGKFSNLSYRLRGIGAATYLRQGGTEALEKYVHTQEFGRLMEQEVISSKLMEQSGQEFLARTDQIYKTIAGTGPVNRKALMEALGALGITDDSIEVFTGAGTGQKRFTVEQMVGTVAGLKQDAEASFRDMSWRLGLSKGPSSQQGVIDVWDAIMRDDSGVSPDMKSYIRERLGKGPQGHMADAVSGKTRSRVGDHIDAARRLSETTTIPTTPTTRSMGSDLMSKLPNLSQAGRVAAGALGGMAAIGIALRIMRGRDTDVKPDELQPAPAQATTGESTTRVLGGQDVSHQGLRLKARGRGSMTPDQAATTANEAIRQNVPVDVNTNVSVKDNTQSFDQGFLSRVFSTILD